MRKKQLGLSMIALLVVSAILISIALVGMKMAPSYIEFFAIKKAVNALAAESRGGASVADIRKGFEKRATIDTIDSVKASDLEITKDASGVVISVGYRKDIPLVADIGIYVDFKAVSKE
jgi:Domain of unknown function (DUF4845)